jgi:hypothetical protein
MREMHGRGWGDVQWVRSRARELKGTKKLARLPPWHAPCTEVAGKVSLTAKAGRADTYFCKSMARQSPPERRLNARVPVSELRGENGAWTCDAKAGRERRLCRLFREAERTGTRVPAEGQASAKS